MSNSDKLKQLKCAGLESCTWMLGSKPTQQNLKEDSMFSIKSLVAAAAVGLLSATAGAATVADLSKDGPFAIDSQAVVANGFGKGTIYAPKQAGSYTLVAVCPGFVSPESSMTAISKRLATHGFVVVTIGTTTLLDLPSSRASQILAALKAAQGTTTGNVAGKIDSSRLVASGWSMGGGGTLEAALKTPGLKSAVAYAPWDTNATQFKGITVPTLIFGATGDIIAPVKSHSQKFYDAIPTTTPKALAVLQGSSHFFPNTAIEPVSYTNIAWNKFFVDGDTSYGDVLGASYVDKAWASIVAAGF
jgi:dienelactone hydrolase